MPCYSTQTFIHKCSSNRCEKFICNHDGAPSPRPHLALARSFHFWMTLGPCRPCTAYEKGPYILGRQYTWGIVIKACKQFASFFMYFRKIWVLHNRPETFAIPKSRVLRFWHQAKCKGIVYPVVQIILDSWKVHISVRLLPSPSEWAWRCYVSVSL